MNQLKFAKLNDTYELEITFYDKNSLKPEMFTNIYANNKIAKLNQGTQNEDNTCIYSFSDCSKMYDACLISSPNFPGSYMRNLKCQYHIKNEPNNNRKPTTRYKVEKLILINAISQHNSHLCGNQTSASTLDGSQKPNTFFCGSSPRSSHCNQYDDYIKIYAESFKQNDDETALKSPILMKKVCGIANLPKIVTLQNSLLIEFESASDGLLSSMGFMYYALSQKKYFENYELFNRFDEREVKSQHELNSIIALEKLHVEHCDSDMNSCVLTFNEDIIMQIYPSEYSSRYDYLEYMCILYIK